MAGGRKLEFDKQAALEAAMRVFWQKGYLGASLSDLTNSMGINKPSMYSAFGNKEKLFLKATHYYIEHYAKSHSALLTMPDTPLKTRLKNYLMSVVAGQCDAAQPKGCYVTLCMSEAASGCMPREASELLSEAAVFMPNLFEAFFTQDPQAIEAGLNKAAKRNALCLATTIAGTATMARAELSLADLEPVIDNTLKGLGV